MKMRLTLGLICLASLAFAAAPAAAQSAQSGDKTAPAETPPLKKLTNADPAPRRGFNVVLLVGDMMDSGGQDTVPVAARKALADMKDFLPYKSYRLMDTQWVLGSNSGPAIVRLRGSEDQEFELELRASPVSPTGMSVRFFLRESGDAAGGSDSGRTTVNSKEQTKADTTTLEIGREIYQLERERDELGVVMENGRRKVEVGLLDPAELKQPQVRLSAINKRIADLRQSMASTSVKTGRTVIDTSFRMDDGETVVVGTSKVKGNGKALIALLSATVDRAKSSTK